jgi:hypothetical protein
VSDVSPGDEERVARELAEALASLKVEDVLLNALMTVSSIGYRRLGATPETRDDRDLEQTRLAIETMQALVPVLERFLPGDLVRDFSASVANLQLAYAKAASERGPAEPEEPTAAEDEDEEPSDAPGG